MVVRTLDYGVTGLSTIAQTVITCTDFALDPFPNKPWFLRVCRKGLLKTLRKKREIARNEQFLFFSKVFSFRFESFLPFSLNIKLSSANSFSLEDSKMCRLGKG